MFIFRQSRIQKTTNTCSHLSFFISDNWHSFQGQTTAVVMGIHQLELQSDLRETWHQVGHAKCRPFCWCEAMKFIEVPDTGALIVCVRSSSAQTLFSFKERLKWKKKESNHRNTVAGLHAASHCSVHGFRRIWKITKRGQTHLLAYFSGSLPKCKKKKKKAAYMLRFLYKMVLDHEHWNRSGGSCKNN